MVSRSSAEPYSPTSLFNSLGASGGRVPWSAGVPGIGSAQEAAAGMAAPADKQHSSTIALTHGFMNSSVSAQLFDQLFDAREQLLFAACVVGEAQFQPPVEAIFLRPALDQLQHPLRIALVPFLEHEVAAGRTGVDLAYAELRGAQLEPGGAEQRLSILRH